MPNTEITKAMLAKIRRAYRKAQYAPSRITSERCRELCEKLLAAGVDPLAYTSYQLSQYIRGRIEMKDLSKAAERKGAAEAAK